jgi:hypothetical protein
VDCSWLNTLLKPPPEADGLGRVTPCAARQLSNLLNAAANPPDPPNPPAGRSAAQALRALLIVVLLGALPLELLPLELPPLELPPREPVTPCSRRQLKYALAPPEPDELPEPDEPPGLGEPAADGAADAELHAARASSKAGIAAPATRIRLGRLLEKPPGKR